MEQGAPAADAAAQCKTRPAAVTTCPPPRITQPPSGAPRPPSPKTPQLDHPQRGHPRPVCRGCLPAAHTAPAGGSEAPAGGELEGVLGGRVPGVVQAARGASAGKPRQPAGPAQRAGRTRIGRPVEPQRPPSLPLDCGRVAGAVCQVRPPDPRGGRRPGGQAPGHEGPAAHGGGVPHVVRLLQAAGGVGALKHAGLPVPAGQEQGAVQQSRRGERAGTGCVLRAPAPRQPSWPGV